MSLINENILLYQAINTEDKIQKCTGLLYNQFVKECVQNNQYISLSNTTINRINTIYKELVAELRRLSDVSCEQTDLKQIVENHRIKLITAIQNNTYEDEQKQLFIPCAEYSGEFQNQILRTDRHQLCEPILDVGCGISYELITLLRKKGYSQVYGLDQYVSNDSKIMCSNWFDYIFRENTWGTVIAHMSFSNHLRRSVIHKDENEDRYVHKYFEILYSLKIGGTYIYTPSVKELEDKISRTEYKIQYYRNVTDSNLDTAYITRLL